MGMQRPTVRKYAEIKRSWNTHQICPFMSQETLWKQRWNDYALWISYDFQFGVFMGYLSMRTCVSLHFLYFFFGLLGEWLFCHITICLILFILFCHYPLDACLFSKKRQKGCGSRLDKRYKGNGSSRGKGNHSQTILYENSISNKLKKKTKPKHFPIQLILYHASNAHKFMLRSWQSKEEHLLLCQKTWVHFQHPCQVAHNGLQL